MFDEPDLHIISFADVGDDRRADRDRQRAEGRRFSIDDLTGVLAGLGVATGDVVGYAEAIVDHLFITAGRDGDDKCLCSCHPRLPETDFHGYGFACSCQLSAEERAAAWQAWLAAMDAHRDSAEGRARETARQAEEDELLAWLVGHPNVVVSNHGGLAPEQWRGSVEGHSFYFRERHDQWRVELDEGEVIAEGTTGIAGYGRTPAERIDFITGIVRDHLRVQHCQVHTTDRDAWERRFGRQLVWCPACGAKL